MPKGTDDQVGFLVPQSKQICAKSIHAKIALPLRTYFVRRLHLELFEDLLGLPLGSGGHLFCSDWQVIKYCAVILAVGQEQGL